MRTVRGTSFIELPLVVSRYRAPCPAYAPTESWIEHIQYPQQAKIRLRVGLRGNIGRQHRWFASAVLLQLQMGRQERRQPATGRSSLAVSGAKKDGRLPICLRETKGLAVNASLAPLTAIIAARRSRSPAFWAVVGFAFGMWALAIVLLMSRHNDPDYSPDSDAA